MKKYRKYSIVLIIGLLSFNTLSGCVNRKQALGGNYLTTCFEQEKSVWATSTKLAKCAIIAVISVPLCITPFVWVLVHHYSKNQSIASSTHHTMHGTNSSLIQQIDRPMHTLLNSNMTIKTPKNLANGKRGNDVSLIKNPMVLEKAVLEDIKKNDFSEKKIAYWLDKGLNINAKDKETGSTLLMHAVLPEHTHTDGIKRLLNKEAKADEQNNFRQTALMLAVGKGNEPLVRLLLKHKPGVCIKDHNNHIARDFTASITDSDKQTRIWSLLTEAMKKEKCVSYPKRR